MRDGDTGQNALIGALLSTVLVGVVPFAPLFGGGVAGYLQGGNRSTGVRIGLYAGLIALVPAFLVLLFVGAIFLSVIGVGGMPALGSLGFLFVLVLFAGMAVYVVGLSVVGGLLGNYVRRDTGFGNDRAIPLDER